MLQLYLLRHAKSSWDDPELGDFDRPLNKRGYKAAPAVGNAMKRRGIKPELVLCSSAKRTLETWNLVAAELDCKPELRELHGIYLATPLQLLRQIRETPDEVSSLLLVGHNPGLELLAIALAGPESDQAALNEMSKKYPTAALASFEVELESWRDLTTARLMDFMKPRSL
jgi:phosphohistidine phosphatase